MYEPIELDLHCNDCNIEYGVIFPEVYEENNVVPTYCPFCSGKVDTSIEELYDEEIEE
jgi:hypothetical protein